MKIILIFALLAIGCGSQKAKECTTEAEELQETIDALVECEEELDQMTESCFQGKGKR
jgi:hypothetical protein